MSDIQLGKSRRGKQKLVSPRKRRFLEAPASNCHLYLTDHPWLQRRLGKEASLLGPFLLSKIKEFCKEGEKNGRVPFPLQASISCSLKEVYQYLSHKRVPLQRFSVKPLFGHPKMPLGHPLLFQALLVCDYSQATIRTSEG